MPDLAAASGIDAPRAPTGWTLLSYGYGLLVTAGLAYFLLGVPVQLTDSYGNLMHVADGTLASQVYNQFYQRSYLRPLLWGHLRVVYDLSGGDYFAWFRGWHVGQVAVLIVLFLRLLRPRTAADAAAVPIGLAALVGIHTFAGTVLEAFPINTFMTILICCLAAADLALGPPRWWRDVLAALLFVFAALTVESGLLVGAVLVAAFAAGARGVSWRGQVALFALLAGYLYLRFVLLHVGAPDLVERSSGYGFSTLDPDDLIARFGGNRLPFYAYNVAAQIGSVLFAEPRGGVFSVTHDVVTGNVRTASVVSVAASTLGSALIAAYAWARRAAWRRRAFDRGDQLVIVFAIVTVANAVISYAYTKDVIMSPAGVFFALALAVAVGRAAAVSGRRRVMALLVGAVLLAASGAWGLRYIGVHLQLRHAAIVQRNEWAYADQWFAREHQTLSAEGRRLKEQLQGDAVITHPAPPTPFGSWLEWFEE